MIKARCARRSLPEFTTRQLELDAAFIGQLTDAGHAYAVVAGDERRPAARGRADTMRCAALFKRDALDALVSEAGDPSFGDAVLLGRILTAELALTIVDAGLGMAMTGIAHGLELSPVG